MLIGVHITGNGENDPDEDKIELKYRTTLGERIRRLSVSQPNFSSPLGMVGTSKVFEEKQRRLLRFARTGHSVLLQGETGTGKEEFARALYLLSQRSDQPFFATNCAYHRDSDLAISELFGHEKGAFTGAQESRQGLFRKAEGGVLFLDEVGELELRTQAMLLRAIGRGEITPLGSSKATSVNVRLIAATNRPLKTQVKSGNFREDLYHRLCKLRLTTPPVRSRGDDWKLLFDHFIRKTAEEHGAYKKLSEEAQNLLEDYKWPGNVREIENMTATGFCLSDENLIHPEHISEILDEAGFGSVGSDRATKPTSVPIRAYRRFKSMRDGKTNFWEAVRTPFMNRDISRPIVRQIIRMGLDASEDGSYKSALKIFQIEKTSYKKFIDFLRHHNLQPVET
jgi:DNA-binding NtrC family response regulator